MKKHKYKSVFPEGVRANACCALPTAEDHAKAMRSIEDRHPDWSWARIYQRAMVEAFSVNAKPSRENDGNQTKVKL